MPQPLSPFASSSPRPVDWTASANASATSSTSPTAQEATRTRDDEAAHLRALLSDASKVAKIALADRPQMRERLGLLER